MPAFDHVPDPSGWAQYSMTLISALSRNGICRNASYVRSTWSMIVSLMSTTGTEASRIFIFIASSTPSIPGIFTSATTAMSWLDVLPNSPSAARAVVADKVSYPADSSTRHQSMLNASGLMHDEYEIPTHGSFRFAGGTE